MREKLGRLEEECGTGERAEVLEWREEENPRRERIREIWDLEE